MSKRTPESAVLSGCLRFLEKAGIYHWRNSAGAVRIGPGRFIRFGKAGSSDIEGVLPEGRFLAVECKAEGGRLSPEQKRFLAEVEALGGLAVTVRGWRELDAALRGRGILTTGCCLGEGISSMKTKPRKDDLEGLQKAAKGRNKGGGFRALIAAVIKRAIDDLRDAGVKLGAAEKDRAMAFVLGEGCEAYWHWKSTMRP